MITHHARKVKKKQEEKQNKNRAKKERRKVIYDHAASPVVTFDKGRGVKLKIRGLLAIRVISKAKIIANGKTIKVNVMWDTGGGMTKVSPELAARLGLKPIGRYSGYDYRHFRCSGNRYSGVMMKLGGGVTVEFSSVADMFHVVSKNDVKYDVIICMDVISKGDLTIGAIGGRFTRPSMIDVQPTGNVEALSTLPNGNAFWYTSNVGIEYNGNGITTNVIWDTGTGITTVPWAVCKDLNIPVFKRYSKQRHKNSTYQQTTCGSCSHFDIYFRLCNGTRVPCNIINGIYCQGAKASMLRQYESIIGMNVICLGTLKLYGCVNKAYFTY